MNQDDESSTTTSEIPHILGVGTIPNGLERTGCPVGKVTKSVSITAEAPSVDGEYTKIRDHRLGPPGFPVLDIGYVNLDHRALY
jgi:hypothetical protein